jgi:hypothetical protein
MGAVELNGIQHDVVDETVYHYRRWRISCLQESVWISVETTLSNANDTNCMACIAERK